MGATKLVPDEEPQVESAPEPVVSTPGLTTRSLLPLSTRSMPRAGELDDLRGRGLPGSVSSSKEAKRWTIAVAHRMIP
jgi:hypothetical protein